MKTICSLIILSTLVLFVSCETEPIQKNTPKITLSKKSAEIIEADHAFGFELFKEICRDSEEENITIPLSIPTTRTARTSFYGKYSRFEWHLEGKVNVALGLDLKINCHIAIYQWR